MNPLGCYGRREVGNAARTIIKQVRQKDVFDEMWDIPRLYVSACSNSCQLVPLHPIIIKALVDQALNMHKLFVYSA
jgi:hypothetical protein